MKTPVNKYITIAILALAYVSCKKPANPVPGSTSKLVQIDTPDIARGLTMLVNGVKWAATDTKAEIGKGLHIEAFFNGTHRLVMETSVFRWAGSYVMLDSSSDKWIYITLTNLSTDSSIPSVLSNVVFTKVSDTDIQGAFRAGLFDGVNKSTQLTEGRFNIPLK